MDDVDDADGVRDAEARRQHTLAKLLSRTESQEQSYELGRHVSKDDGEWRKFADEQAVCEVEGDGLRCANAFNRHDHYSPRPLSR